MVKGSLPKVLGVEIYLDTDGEMAVYDGNFDVPEEEMPESLRGAGLRFSALKQQPIPTQYDVSPRFRKLLLTAPETIIIDNIVYRRTEDIGLVLPGALLESQRTL